jgi:hypothetical protein
LPLWLYHCQQGTIYQKLRIVVPINHRVENS